MEAVASGDTLFAEGIGRTDLPGGEPAVFGGTLSRIMSLPDETLVYPGHGPETTVGDEKRTNPFIARL